MHKEKQLKRKDEAVKIQCIVAETVEIIAEMADVEECTNEMMHLSITDAREYQKKINMHLKRWKDLIFIGLMHEAKEKILGA